MRSITLLRETMSIPNISTKVEIEANTVLAPSSTT